LDGSSGWAAAERIGGHLAVGHLTSATKLVDGAASFGPLGRVALTVS
jgi:hypothetical protein